MSEAHIYCPKVGKPRVSTSLHASTCSKQRCTYYNGNRDLSAMCPNPLEGQEITFSVVPTPPFFIDPSFFGKPGGLVYNVFAYHTERFKFKTKIIFNGISSYHPQNNTFGPGMYQDVSRHKYLVSHNGSFPTSLPGCIWCC